MLDATTVEAIRRDHFESGMPIRQIARDRSLSRNTVRKALRHGAESFRYRRTSQPRPRIGAWTTELEGMLEENLRRHCQNRETIVQLHRRLSDLGYDGSYDSVRRFAARWRAERSSATASIPMRFEPGEAYRFDWSQEEVVLDGTPTAVHIAHMRLCYSHAFLVRAYSRDAPEMWCDAHDRAFGLFGGACATGIYSHSKPPLRRVIALSPGEFRPELLDLAAHYGVRPIACKPSGDWRKSSTERQFRDARRPLFDPPPTAPSLAALNDWLESRCVEEAKRRRHPALDGSTVWQAFERERPALSPAGTPFDGHRASNARASLTCLVPFERNRYSVHAEAAGRQVEIRAHADRIRVIFQGEAVADHPRSFETGRIVYDPIHYLPALAAKPCALRNGAPFREWRPPGAIGAVCRKLSDAADADRQIVEILSHIPRLGQAAVESACRKALAGSDCSARAVERILTRNRPR